MPSRSLTRRIFPFVVTVVAGTTTDAPNATTLDVPDTLLRRVEVVIPSGHAALTGLALSMQGQQMIPWPDTFPWLVGDDAQLGYDIPGDLEVDGSLVAHTYNLDIYEHSFYLRFTLDDLVLKAPASSGPVNAVVL